MQDYRKKKKCLIYINPQLKVLRHLDRIHSGSVVPVTIEMDLSNRCVLGCDHCHFAHTHTKGSWATRNRDFPKEYSNTGDLADTELTIDLLKDFKDIGIKSVVWSGGGEPTTHPEWQKIITEAKTIGLPQGMYTCGILLNPESGKVLASNMEWVVVSLDAIDKDTYFIKKGGDFNIACNGVKSMVGHGAVIGVAYLINEENWKQMPQMIRLSRSLGADYTLFRPEIKHYPLEPSKIQTNLDWITEAMPTINTLHEEPDVEIQPHRFTDYRDWSGHGYDYCEGIKLNATVTPDGRIWMCCQRRGVTQLGDLSRETLEVVLKRHPRGFYIDKGCRVMCRLHYINKTIAQLTVPIEHEVFI